MNRIVAHLKKSRLLRKLQPYGERQLAKNDCGVSVLQTILRLNGEHIQRHQIRDAMLLDEEGSSFEDLRHYLGQHGVQSRYRIMELGSASPEQLKTMLPCVAMVQTTRYKHYVLVQEVVGSDVIVMDPANGTFESRDFNQFIASLARISTQADEQLAYAYMAQAVERQLQEHAIELVAPLSREKIVSYYNRLKYHEWLTSQLPSHDPARSATFLQELLASDDESIIPSRFKTFRLTATDLAVKSPVLMQFTLSGKNPAVAEPTQTEPVPRLLGMILQHRQLRRDLLFYLGLGFLTSLLALLVVYANQILIDEIIPTRELGSLYVFIGCLFFFRAFELSQHVIRTLFEIRIGQSVDKWLVDTFNRTVLHAESEDVASYTRGELTQRMNDVLRIKTVISGYINDYIFNVFIVLFAGLMSLRIYQSAALVIIVVSAAYYLLLRKSTRYVKQLESTRFTRKGELITTHLNVVDGHSTIKKSQTEQRFFERQHGRLLEYLDVQRRSQLASQLLAFLPRFIAICGSLTIAMLATRAHVLHNELSMGQIFTLVALGEMAFLALRTILKTQINLQEQAVVIDRFFELVRLSAAPSSADADREVRRVEISGLHYAYPGKGFTLSVPSLTLLSGDRILLEGGNGSGKSTLLKILSGLLQRHVAGDLVFYDADGVPLTKVDGFGRVAIIRAEDKIFNDTVQFNVVFHHSRRVPDIYRCARDVGADDFISPRKFAIDALVHDHGANLSTGQRRKLLLMRGLLAESDVVIFDEIFRGIDAESKKKIIETLNRYAPEKIIIYTSHEPVDGLRLNRRLLLDGGILSESGSQVMSKLIG